MIVTRLVSSLEKAFSDELPTQYPPLTRITALRNERFSFQILLRADADETALRTLLETSIGGALAPYVHVRTVEQIPVAVPSSDLSPDDGWLRLTPGLYPDLLRPLHYEGRIPAVRGYLTSAWFTVEPEGGLPAGEHTLTVSLRKESGEEVAVHTLSVEILDAELPPQEMIFTQWFYCDCLAQYYHCEVWSERHWSIIEHYLRTAVANGVNMILTPTHTPPLDTGVGGERLTTQLVDITRENGIYRFGFERLDRWIDLCDRVGIRYFEIAHLFTQWGAEHAPKIVATVDGEERRIFGWETDAAGEDYTAFLGAYLPALLEHMRARGDDHRCYFHISDEPNSEQLASYLAAKNTVADLLRGYPIMDALSDVTYYKEGIAELPIPASDHIEPFLDENITGLWTYYCCVQTNLVSNRMIAMPLWRTRSIGMQLYKFRIAGFLHWGYNFYNNQYSRNTVDPYLDTTGEYWVPGGDPFSVYPEADGTPLESVRLLSFYDALQDARAMRLAESRYGHERVVRELEEAFGGEIRFDRCANTAETMLAVRERVNDLIRATLQK